MRFIKSLLVVVAGAFLGYIAFNNGTERVQLYNGPMSQGHVQIEKIDRRPFRRDDRLTEIIQEDRTILFRNYAPGASPFLEDKGDYIKVRTNEGLNLTKSAYWKEHAEDPEVQELIELFRDVSNQYANIKIDQDKQKAEEEYAKKHKRTID